MNREQKSCGHCGVAFERDVRYSRAYFARQKYCSQACYGAAHSAISNLKRPSLKEAFERKVVKAEGCWSWSGLKDKDGYGLLPYARKQLRAHVVALQIDDRPVPKGFYGCHTCDNPGCVNPAHLYVGTPTQNVQDAIERGRVRHGRKAKLSADQVRAIRAAPGTHAEIAAAYGVTPSNITMIRTGRTWRSAL